MGGWGVVGGKKEKNLEGESDAYCVHTYIHTLGPYSASELPPLLVIR